MSEQRGELAMESERERENIIFKVANIKHGASLFPRMEISRPIFSFIFRVPVTIVGNEIKYLPKLLY